MRAPDPAPLAARRPAQLAALIDGLAALTEVLARDPDPRRPWRRHFVDCRVRAVALAEEFAHEPGPLPPARLRELAGSVTSVYGGMGSFNDYVPSIRTPDGRNVLPPGMEQLGEVSGRVYEAALALRVVGDAP